MFGMLYHVNTFAEVWLKNARRRPVERHRKILISNLDLDTIKICQIPRNSTIIVMSNAL